MRLAMFYAFGKDFEVRGKILLIDINGRFIALNNYLIMIIVLMYFDLLRFMIRYVCLRLKNYNCK